MDKICFWIDDYADGTDREYFWVEEVPVDSLPSKQYCANELQYGSMLDGYWFDTPDEAIINLRNVLMQRNAEMIEELESTLERLKGVQEKLKAADSVEKFKEQYQTERA